MTPKRADIGEAFRLGLDDCRSPEMLAVLIRSILLSVLLFFLFFAGVWIAFRALPMPEWGILERWDLVDEGRHLTRGLLALLTFLVSVWFLFVPAAVAIMNLFLDGAILFVENRHYPNSPPLRRIGVLSALWEGARFIISSLAVNAALFPVYALLIVSIAGIPLVAPLAFLANAWLMTREMFLMVAARHMPRGDALRLIRHRRGPIMMAGMICLALFMIPFANLAAPLVTAAVMVHLFHAMERNSPRAALERRSGP